MRLIRKTPILTESEKERFLHYVCKAEAQDCWMWTGAQTKGYGVFCLKRNNKWQNYRASRLMYALNYGAVDDSKFVAHRCDHPECMNPEHYFLTSNEGNMADMRMKTKLAEMDFQRRSMLKIQKKVILISSTMQM